jgi:hypothetical protein
MFFLILANLKDNYALKLLYKCNTFVYFLLLEKAKGISAIWGEKGVIYIIGLLKIDLKSI